MLDARRILEVPPVYNMFQRMVGGGRFRRQFIETYVVPFATGGRLLEIGCGPGTNCRYIPANVQYVGSDISAEYIDYAKKHFGQQAQFFVTPVGQLATLGAGRFDAIMGIGILHHISDDEIITLCDEVLELLRPGGAFITGDPCFTPEQSFIERSIVSFDRGKYVRVPKQYKAIIEKRFKHVRQDVKSAGMFIPGTCVSMTATNI